jgi:hypothetical protein
MTFSKANQPKNKGGRPKGAKARSNKLTDDQRKSLALAAGGITPLEFACSVIRDPKATMRDKQWACGTLMPYMHRKLPIAIEGGDPSKPISILDIGQLKDLSNKEIQTFMKLIEKAGGNITTDADGKEV